MPRTRSVLAAAVAGGTVAVFTPTGLRAQNPFLLEAFAARAEASEAPLFGGFGFTAYRGPFGVRLGGAMNFDRDARTVTGVVGGGRGGRGGRVVTQQRVGSLGVGAWTADADFLVEPLRTVPALRTLFLGFSPYAFGGVGRYAVRPNAAADTSVGTLSYGAGVRRALFGALGLTAEARVRRSLRSDSALSTDAFRQRAQYRIGFTLGFGGPRAQRAPAPAVVEAPIVAAAPAPPAAAAPAAGVGPRVLDLADGYVNTPYRAAGTTPADGFDGPGFVQHVFGREGVALPRTARELAEAGSPVATRAGALRAGDLLLFANDGVTVDHVAIYAGRDRFVHATSSGGGVRYDVLGEGARGRWFADHLVGARRVTGDAPTRPRPGDVAPPPAAQ